MERISRRGLLTGSIGVVGSSLFSCIGRPRLEGYDIPSNNNRTFLINPQTRNLDLTLGTWNIEDIPFFGKYESSERRSRMERVVDVINRLSYSPNIIGFQEAFVLGSRREIYKGINNMGNIDIAHQKSNFWGGLFTVSSYPIEGDGNFHLFSDQGDPTQINLGDFYAQKGVLHTRHLTPFGEIDFYNTHIHALYSRKRELDEEHKERNREIRISQRKELVDYIDNTCSGIAAFCGGDFNFRSEENEESFDEYLEFCNYSKFKRFMNLRSKKEHLFMVPRLNVSPELMWDEEADNKYLDFNLVEGVIEKEFTNHLGYFSTARIKLKS